MAMQAIASVSPALRPQVPQRLSGGDSGAFGRLMTSAGRELPATGIESGMAKQLDRTLDGLEAGRRRMDDLIQQARSGKHFQPAELLAMQAEVFRITETAALTQKVVEAGVSGMRRLWSMQL